MYDHPIPAWKINAIFKGLPARRGLWHGPERRAKPRDQATDARTWREPEQAPRTFGKRPVRPFAVHA